MRVPRLFVPKLTTGTLELGDSESQHALAALRLGRGDCVLLFDGRGRRAEALIERIDTGRATVLVRNISSHGFETDRRVILCIAPPRAHRQAFLVEKCTELGVAEFWPINCERSTIRPQASTRKRWERWAVEASKQSERNWVPVVRDPGTFPAALQQARTSRTAALLDPSPGSIPVRDFLGGSDSKKIDATQSTNDVAPTMFLIGPEGGWSEDERSSARLANIPFIRLGPTILRVETAAVAICALTLLVDESPT